MVDDNKRHRAEFIDNLASIFEVRKYIGPNGYTFRPTPMMGVDFVVSDNGDQGQTHP